MTGGLANKLRWRPCWSMSSVSSVGLSGLESLSLLALSLLLLLLLLLQLPKVRLQSLRLAFCCQGCLFCRCSASELHQSSKDEHMYTVGNLRNVQEWNVRSGARKQRVVAATVRPMVRQFSTPGIPLQPGRLLQVFSVVGITFSVTTYHSVNRSKRVSVGVRRSLRRRRHRRTSTATQRQRRWQAASALVEQ